jgi:tetratricopeptide (TPR) repeat protein
MFKKKFILLWLGLSFVLSACLSPKAPPAGQPELAAKDFNFFLRHGSLCLTRGDYAAAAEQFGQAILLNPQSARAYNLQGIAYFELKDYALAAAQFQSAISLDASYADAYNNLGSVYFALRQFGPAEKMYKTALSLSPNSVSTHYSLGTILLIQGKVEEGTRYLSRGIELDPGFLETHSALLVDVPTPGANWSEAYFTYAKLYAQVGNVDKAYDYLRKAQKAGFRDWHRIVDEREFEGIRQDPRIKDFIR